LIRLPSYTADSSDQAKPEAVENIDEDYYEEEQHPLLPKYDSDS